MLRLDFFLEFETKKRPQELATGKQEAGEEEIAVAERPGALSPPP